MEVMKRICFVNYIPTEEKTICGEKNSVEENE